MDKKDFLMDRPAEEQAIMAWYRTYPYCAFPYIFTTKENIVSNDY